MHSPKGRVSFTGRRAGKTSQAALAILDQAAPLEIRVTGNMAGLQRVMERMTDKARDTAFLLELAHRARMIRAQVRTEIANKFADMMRERFPKAPGAFLVRGSYFEHRRLYADPSWPPDPAGPWVLGLDLAKDQDVTVVIVKRRED